MRTLRSAPTLHWLATLWQSALPVFMGGASVGLGVLLGDCGMPDAVYPPPEPAIVEVSTCREYTVYDAGLGPE